MDREGHCEQIPGKQGEGVMFYPSTLKNGEGETTTYHADEMDEHKL